ncbi:MAG: protein phosphatase 2C domain-containing protein [Cellvibrionaceae bacterium]
MPVMNYGAATDRGLQRSNNEDCYISIPERGLWVVADGMGGHEAGEVASAIVAETIESSTANGKTLVESMQLAHESVLSATDEGKGAKGMGSTVVALQSTGNEYKVAWVGDSRAYLWCPDDSGGTLEQLSTDHSYVQLLLASGAIGEDEVNNHPDKNVITQCIGSLDVERIHVDSVKGMWDEKQWVLLCSDGLTDELTDEEIAQVLCLARTPREAVAKLINNALKKGGRDNITVQIIESPLTKYSPFSFISDWLPQLSGNQRLDWALYSFTSICFVFLCYWLLFSRY